MCVRVQQRRVGFEGVAYYCPPTMSILGFLPSAPFLKRETCSAIICQRPPSICEERCACLIFVSTFLMSLFLNMPQYFAQLLVHATVQYTKHFVLRSRSVCLIIKIYPPAAHHDVSFVAITQFDSRLLSRSLHCVRIPQGSFTMNVRADIFFSRGKGGLKIFKKSAGHFHFGGVFRADICR